MIGENHPYDNLLKALKFNNVSTVLQHLRCNGPYNLLSSVCDMV